MQTPAQTPRKTARPRRVRLAASALMKPFGGWVHALFTRREWRRRGVGAALLADAFGRFWARGERSIGLGVDAANATGAFHLYERAGMIPALGWVVYEKELGGRVRTAPGRRRRGTA